MKFKRLIYVISKTQHQEVLLASTVLAILVFSFFGIDTVRSFKNEVKTAEITTKNLTQVLELHLAEIFDLIDFRLTDLETDFAGHAIHEQINKPRNSFSSEVSHYFTVDKNLKLVHSFSNDSDIHLKMPESFGDEIKKDPVRELHFSEPVWDQVSGRWFFYMARPMYNTQSKFTGIVAVQISLDFMQKYFDSLNVGALGTVSLFNYRKTIYARKPFLNEVIAQVKKSHKDFSLDEVEKTFSAVSPIDDTFRFITARKIDRYPFGVAVGLARSEVLSAWLHRTLFNSILILSAFVGFAIFLVRYLESQEALEEQRKQTVQNSKMSSLGEMASGIAHEINNPLAIIQAKVFQVRKLVEASEIDRNKILEHANKLEQTVERIAKIIKGLKSFSRNADDDPMACSSIAAILDSTLELCRAKFKHHGILLKISEIPDVYIKCRESQLAQVMLNFLNNSFDAVENLEEKWVSIEISSSAENVMISVVDSGRGIPDAVLEKIMYPFFTTKEVGKGTGLGLSISKGIVEAHGGAITYDSTSTHTRFVVTLPKLNIISNVAA